MCRTFYREVFLGKSAFDAFFCAEYELGEEWYDPEEVFDFLNNLIYFSDHHYSLCRATILPGKHSDTFQVRFFKIYHHISPEFCSISKSMNHERNRMRLGTQNVACTFDAQLLSSLTVIVWLDVI